MNQLNLFNEDNKGVSEEIQSSEIPIYERVDDMREFIGTSALDSLDTINHIDCIHLICHCNRNNMVCWNEHMWSQCKNFNELAKQNISDLYYHWKRKCNDNYEYSQFKKYFI